MFTTSDIIGDIIFISLYDVEKFNDIGINEPSGHYKVVGHDHLGVWLEHPGLYMITTEDESGKPLKVDEQIKEEIPANFFLPWGQINTMMHYPDREGYDFPDLFKKSIGFKVNDKKKNA